MWVFCHGGFPRLTPPTPMQQQKSPHRPAPAKTRYRMSDLETLVGQDAFSTPNSRGHSFEDCTGAQRPGTISQRIGIRLRLGLIAHRPSPFSPWCAKKYARDLTDSHGSNHERKSNCSIRENPRRSVANDFWLVLRQVSHRQIQIVRLRQNRIFEDRLVRDEYVFRCDASHGSVQLIK